MLPDEEAQRLQAIYNKGLFAGCAITLLFFAVVVNGILFYYRVTIVNG